MAVRSTDPFVWPSLLMSLASYHRRVRMIPFISFSLSQCKRTPRVFSCGGRSCAADSEVKIDIESVPSSIVICNPLPSSYRSLPSYDDIGPLLNSCKVHAIFIVSSAVLLNPTSSLENTFLVTCLWLLELPSSSWYSVFPSWPFPLRRMFCPRKHYPLSCSFANAESQ